MRLKKQYGILYVQYSVYCLYSYSKISMSNPVFVLYYSIQYTVQIRKVKNVLYVLEAPAQTTFILIVFHKG